MILSWSGHSSKYRLYWLNLLNLGDLVLSALLDCKANFFVLVTEVLININTFILFNYWKKILLKMKQEKVEKKNSSCKTDDNFSRQVRYELQHACIKRKENQVFWYSAVSHGNVIIHNESGSRASRGTKNWLVSYYALQKQVITEEKASEETFVPLKCSDNENEFRLHQVITGEKYPCDLYWTLTGQIKKSLHLRQLQG